MNSTTSNSKQENSGDVVLFYGTNTGKTGEVAKKIQQAWNDSSLKLINIENVSKEDFERYNNIIVGISTWFDGELPTNWDELVPELDALSMKNKKVAIFGLGDQVGYPDNFADGIGILADIFTNTGATLIGFTSLEGYSFNRSQALKDGAFQGLVIDEENQPDKTDERVKAWVGEIKKAFQ